MLDMDSENLTKQFVINNQNQKFKAVTPSVVRRGLCMLREDGKCQDTFSSNIDNFLLGQVKIQGIEMPRKWRGRRVS